MERSTFRIGGDFSPHAVVYFGVADGSTQELRLQMKGADLVLAPPPGALLRLNSARTEAQLHLSSDMLRIRWHVVSIPERPRLFPMGSEEFLRALPANVPWVERRIDPHLRITLATNAPWFFITDLDFTDLLNGGGTHRDEGREIAQVLGTIVGNCSLRADPLSMERAANIARTLNYHREMLGDDYERWVAEAAASFPALEGWHEKMMALVQAV